MVDVGQGFQNCANGKLKIAWSNLYIRFFRTSSFSTFIHFFRRMSFETTDRQPRFIHVGRIDVVDNSLFGFLYQGWPISIGKVEKTLKGSQRYTYRVLQTIQMKLILLWAWAERAVLGRAKTPLKFKYEIQIGQHIYHSMYGAGYKLEK